MVENHNTFWLWDKDIDWILRGDVRYWLPRFIETEEKIKPFFIFDEVIKRIFSGKNFRQQNEGNYIFFRTQNLYDILPDLTEVSFTNERGDLIKDGDLLFGRVGKIGTSCVYISETKEATYSDNVLKVELDKDKINPFFVSVFLASKFGQIQFERQQKGSNQPLLDTENLRRLKILNA